MAQKVKPDVQSARQFGDRLRELRQLQNVELQVLRQGEAVRLLQKAKPKVMVRHPRKPYMVEEADRNRRFEFKVILALVELLFLRSASRVVNFRRISPAARRQHDSALAMILSMPSRAASVQFARRAAGQEVTEISSDVKFVPRDLRQCRLS